MDERAYDSFLKSVETIFGNVQKLSREAERSSGLNSDLASPEANAVCHPVPLPDDQLLPLQPIQDPGQLRS